MSLKLIEGKQASSMLNHVIGPWKGSGRELPFLVLMLTYANVGTPLNENKQYNLVGPEECFSVKMYVNMTVPDS